MAIYRIRTRGGNWYVETRAKDIKDAMVELGVHETQILEIKPIYLGGTGGAREDIKDCFYTIQNLAKLAAPKVDQLNSKPDFHTAIELIGLIKEKADRARDLLFALEMEQKERG